MTTRVWLTALPLVAVGWIGTLALVMRVAGAPAALVILPPEGFVAGLPQGGGGGQLRPAQRHPARRG